ncbi:hypothetical protein E2C01_052815 [Portunus trituberculatus]|uniref:Uncharacterized protein n=1 Tax=Portunus trituberculatus TaxID=210409 RepID=A0A5B7GMU4_PORTR|nr:hypothetical protein [Portunus trituberculatus]
MTVTRGILTAGYDIFPWVAHAQVSDSQSASSDNSKQWQIKTYTLVLLLDLRLNLRGDVTEDVSTGIFFSVDSSAYAKRRAATASASTLEDILAASYLFTFPSRQGAN